MTQQIAQTSKRTGNGFKMIKVRPSIIEELDKRINKIEKRQPYLNGRISYNAILSLLLSKKEEINLSGYTLVAKKQPQKKKVKINE